MRLTLFCIPLLTLLGWAVMGDSRKGPPYYDDSKFEREFEQKAGPVSSNTWMKALQCLDEEEGVSILLPGVACRYDLPLSRKHRRIRDALDMLADLVQGRWEKVGDTYVLAMQPLQLEIAEMQPEKQQKKARRVLEELLASLNERQSEALRSGRPFTILPTGKQGELLAWLGSLGYWQHPYRINPGALRGTGVLVTLTAEGGAPKANVLLPLRGGGSLPWLAAGASQ